MTARYTRAEGRRCGDRLGWSATLETHGLAQQGSRPEPIDLDPPADLGPPAGVDLPNLGPPAGVDLPAGQDLLANGKNGTSVGLGRGQPETPWIE